MNPRDPRRLEIVTEDSVSFTVRLASPPLRALALGTDLAAIFGLHSLFIALIRVSAWLDEDVYRGVALVSFFVLSLGYFMLLEGLFLGRTLGKQLFGLRVMDVQARRVTGAQLVVRNLFRILDMFPVFYFVGGLAAWISPRFQRLGDLAAGTLVVRARAEERPEAGEMKDRIYNSFRSRPQLESRLRRNTLPEEAALLAQALARRGRLDPRARVELYHEFAEHFRAKARFPVELTENLSDEAFLRNCLDSLTRHQREVV